MANRAVRSLTATFKNIKDGGKLLTLSDLYKEDIPGDANFIPYYPTSAPANKYNKRLFFNEKWRICDDIVPRYASNSSKYYSNHILAGERFKIIGVKAPDYIVTHWKKSLNHDLTIRYGQLNDEIPHVEMFPVERVKDNLHAVNPEAHYEISSKRFLAKVPCQQAAVLDAETQQYPCYVKLCVQQGARGVWKVEDRAQLNDLLTHIEQNMPTADYVINEMIQNAQNTFSTIFYVSKKGEMKWIGVTQPQFAEDGLNGGGQVDMKIQDDLEVMLAPIVRPVSEALNKKGYFGVVDVDVVMNDKKQGFVVDINPRFGSTTKLMLIMHYLKSQGYTYGMIVRKLAFPMNAQDVIKFAEGFEEGKVIVINALETGVGEEVLTKCIFIICAPDIHSCHGIRNKIWNATAISEGKAQVNTLSDTVCGGQSVNL